MKTTYGPAGWVRVVDPQNFVGTLFVRVDGKGRVIQMHLDGEGSELTAGQLRRLPLARYRAQVHTRVDLLAGQWGAPDPDPRSVLDANFPDRGIDTRKRSERINLHPPVDGLTEDFLRQVAAAYTSAVAHGERPNKALADQTKYPRRTIERWVYLARKGGYLAPTRQGEAR